jgi:hypothetical protein
MAYVSWFLVCSFWFLETASLGYGGVFLSYVFTKNQKPKTLFPNSSVGKKTGVPHAG